MVRQRGQGVVAAAAAAKEAAWPRSERAASPKRKLSFKDQRALDGLPGRIEGLRGRLAELEARLGQPAPADQVQAWSAAYAAAKAEIEAAEEEWLRLEMLKEELEGGR
jgi:ATP-binding cassette subfamily F protein uup